MRVLSEEEIKAYRWPSGVSVTRWHEGVNVIGYWAEGDSYVFRGHNGHYFCITRGFLREVFEDKVEITGGEEYESWAKIEATSDCHGHQCSRKGCASCDWRTVQK